MRRYVQASALALVVAALLAAAPAAAYIAILPGAVEGLGVAPARFSSTLVLSNLSDQPADVTIEFVPYAGKPGATPATRTLAPGQTLTQAAVLSAFFGLNADAGALRVTADRALAGSIVTANVANPAATYGVALAAVGERKFLDANDTGHAIWVTQSTQFRTNVAAVLVDPNSSVTVNAYDAAGNRIGQTTVTSATPISWQVPLSDLIGNGDLAIGRVEFVVTAGRVTGYTVVNDNVTGDGIAVPAQKVETIELLIDGVAKANGEKDTFWSTDVRLFNSTGAPIDVTIDAFGFATTKPAVVRSVPAHAVLELAHVLDLFGFTAPAAGALHLKATGGLVAFARTANVDPSGQRAGTFSASQVPVSFPSGLAPSGTSVFLPGLDQSTTSPGFRTNVAFFAGVSGATAALTLRDAAGASRGTASVTLAPFAWRQEKLSDWFPGATIPAGARIDVAVSAGALDGYASKIDNATGDPVILAPSAAVANSSDARLTAFSQNPNPIKATSGGTMTVNVSNTGPDTTEGDVDVVVALKVVQGGAKLVVQGFNTASAGDWTLVSGTFGVSTSVRVRRKSPLAPGNSAAVTLRVGVPGGAAIGGDFDGNTATITVPGDPNSSNNTKTITVTMNPS